MNNNYLNNRPAVTTAEHAAEFWRRILLADGFTVLPCWTLNPTPGVGEHEEKVPNELLAALRRFADELGVPLSSVLLTAHAKVLGALSGEREVSTGYIESATGSPLPCRLTTESRSWRGMVLETHRTRLELLSHVNFPVDALRRELGRTEPLFETVFGPIADGIGELAEETVLRVGFLEEEPVVLRLRYLMEVLDAKSAARIAGYHLAALASMVAD